MQQMEHEHQVTMRKMEEEHQANIKIHEGQMKFLMQKLERLEMLRQEQVLHTNEVSGAEIWAGYWN